MTREAVTRGRKRGAAELKEDAVDPDAEEQPATKKLCKSFCKKMKPLSEFALKRSDCNNCHMVGRDFQKVCTAQGQDEWLAELKEDKKKYFTALTNFEKSSPKNDRGRSSQNFKAHDLSIISLFSHSLCSKTKPCYHVNSINLSVQ